jgi:uncharacterized protein YjbI with pentapeptide repeats
MSFWRRRRRSSELVVEAREVEGPPTPAETRIVSDLRDMCFDPETLRVAFDYVSAARVDFSGLSFDSFSADNCEFADCDFSRVSVEWLPFAGGGSRFLRCRFAGAQIGDFDEVALVECDFTNAHLNGWFTWDADVIDCRFAGRLEGVVFTATDSDGRGHNEIRGNDFRDADLVDVDFRNGVDLDAQLLPESEDYLRIRDLPSTLRRTRAEVKRWANDERRAAFEALYLISRTFDFQPDVFAKREFFVDCADDPRIGERVIDVLLGGRS